MYGLPRQLSPQRARNYSAKIIHPPRQLPSNHKSSQFIYYHNQHDKPRLNLSPKRILSPTRAKQSPFAPYTSSVRVVSPPPQLYKPLRMASPPRISQPFRPVSPNYKVVQQNHHPINLDQAYSQPQNIYYQTSPQQTHSNFLNLKQLNTQRISSEAQKLAQKPSPQIQESHKLIVQRIQSQKIISTKNIVHTPSVKPQPSKIQIPSSTHIASQKGVDEREASTSVNMSRVYSSGFVETQIEDVMRNIEQRLNRIQGISPNISQYYS